MMIALSVSAGHSQFTADLLGVLVSPVGPRVVTVEDGTLLVEFTSDGMAEVAITLDGVSRSYSLTQAALVASQCCLSPPAVAGTAAVGAVLSVTPGLWLVDPAAGQAAAHQWYRDNTAIAGATGLSYTVQASDAGHALTCRETVGAAMAISAPLAIPAPAIAQTMPSLVRVGGFRGSSANTSTPTFMVDLSGVQAGDRLVFFYGPDLMATAATVGGVAASLLADNSAYNPSSGRIACFSHVMTADGVSGTPIVLTLPGGTNQHVLSVHALRGGGSVATGTAHSVNGAAMTVTLTAAAQGAVLATAIGGATEVSTMTWTGIDLIESAAVATASQRGASTAALQGLAGGSLTITAQSKGTGRAGMIALAVAPQ